MTRSAMALDRIAALLVGLVLIAVGVCAVGWNGFLRNTIPESIELPTLVAATQQGWWPWAVAGAGVVLVLLGLRWLLSHTPAAKAGSVPLSVSGDAGRVTADLGAIADAAAQQLEAHPGVHSAKAKAIDDRGLRTLDVTVTATSVPDLGAAAAAADRVCCDAIGMLGDDSVATRTRIHLDRTKRDRRRVD